LDHEEGKEELKVTIKKPKAPKKSASGEAEKK
jgi:hypothetical protein